MSGEREGSGRGGHRNPDRSAAGGGSDRRRPEPAGLDVADEAGAAGPVGRAALRASLEPHGLSLRGDFAPCEEDAVPPLAGGVTARALVLVGPLGGAMWPAFSRSAEYLDGGPDPLDRWSRRVGETLAERLGALALFPFGGPPHRPFVRWATRAEGLRPSRLGLLMHPEAGLWHAYRFALAFAEPLPETSEATPGGVRSAAAHACDECVGQPCLHVCPVDAFDGTGYALDACRTHLAGARPCACLETGCLARNACPVAADHRYPAAQQAFHLGQFLAALERRQSAPKR